MLTLLFVLPALAADPAPASAPTPAPASAPAPSAPVNPNAAIKPAEGTVVFLHREPAVFPPEARAEGISAGGCMVKAFFDEKGVPYRAVAMMCDSVWVDSSVAAAMKYRIQPYVFDGRVRKVQIEMVLVYTAGEVQPQTQGPAPAPEPVGPPAK